LSFAQGCCAGDLARIVNLASFGLVQHTAQKVDGREVPGSSTVSVSISVAVSGGTLVENFVVDCSNISNLYGML